MSLRSRDGRVDTGPPRRLLTMTTQMVDWQLAVTLGSRLAGSGPVVESDEAAAIVAELREGADRSTAYVRGFTGLEAGGRAAPGPPGDPPGGVPAHAARVS